MMRSNLRLASVACLVVLTQASSAQSFLKLGGGLIPSTIVGHRGFADVDGDGDVDLVAPRTAVFLNDGNGLFIQHAIQSPPFGSGTPGQYVTTETDVILEDVNGDGSRDFLGWSQGVPQLALNNGQGVFTAANASFPPLAWPLGVMSMVLGDFDGDGDLDIFVLTRNPNNGGCLVGSLVAPCAYAPKLWLNNGAGVFVDASSQLPAGLLARARRAVARDFDGDGDVDIVYAQYNAAPVFPAAANVMLVNNGAGVFSAAALPGNVVGDSFFVRSGDIDGNGQPDVLILTLSTGPSGYVDIEEILYNQGGSFVSAGTATLGGAAGTELADLNADGRDELIRDLSGQLTVHVAPPGGLFGPPVVQISFPGTQPASGPYAVDIDQDGDRDVISGGRTVLFNDGQSLTPEPVTGPPLSMPPYGVAAGDFDQDGDVDFIHTWGAGVFVDVNDGTGVFTAVQVAASIAGSLAPPVVFDSDGDGDLDVFFNAVGVNLTSSVLMRNDLAEGATMLGGFASFSGATRIRAGDVDLDGDLDLVVGAGYFGHPGPPPPPNYIMLNQGGNVFAAPVPIDAAATPAQTMDIELADVDGDGDLDVIEANVAVYGGGSCRLLSNNGAGVFTPAAAFAGQFADAVEVADLDGDGDQDVVLGTTMYANNGVGLFASVGTLTAFAGPNALPSSPQALTVRDFDGDGILDVLVQGLVSGTPFGTRFMKGLAPFTFGAAELVDGSWGTTILAEHLVADIDRDGDLDVILGSDVYASARRQLVLTGVARIGRPFHLDMFAPAGAGYALFASLGRVDAPLPPLGQLLIDPATGIVVSTGTIPALGFGRTTLPVPNATALVGTTVYWQAFSAADNHLSNLIATTIRN